MGQSALSIPLFITFTSSSDAANVNVNTHTTKLAFAFHWPFQPIDHANCDNVLVATQFCTEYLVMIFFISFVFIWRSSGAKIVIISIRCGPFFSCSRIIVMCFELSSRISKENTKTIWQQLIHKILIVIVRRPTAAILRSLRWRRTAPLVRRVRRIGKRNLYTDCHSPSK